MDQQVTVSRELLRQVLDAACSPYCTQDLGKLIPEIKRCLVSLAIEHEPVAWMMSSVDKETRLTFNRPSAEHRRLFTCIVPLFTAPQPAPQPAPVQEPSWLRLKPFWYAPGGYQCRCHKCGEIVYDLDKHAITCRPCAETMLAAQPRKAVWRAWRTEE